MEISREVLAAIPPENVRVPLDEFAEFWRLAEAECVRLVTATALGETSWEASYVSAVMKTLRWLSAAQVPFGPSFDPVWSPAPGPLVPSSGDRLGPADAASIRRCRDECRAQLVIFPGGYETPGMPARPGYLEGVRDGLEWACFHGPKPRLGVVPTRTSQPAG